MNNVLILSAGRRVELVKEFSIELKNIFPQALVFTTDMCPEMSAACQFADVAVKAPRVTDIGYVDFLIDICEKNDIGLVIPTIDTELLTLAQSRDIFFSKGINLIVSSIELIANCRDKRKSAKLFKKLNIDTPNIYSHKTITFPCFAKPYDGSCSIGAVALHSEDCLTNSIKKNEKMIYMELIDGTYQEFTVDVYYNKQGKLTCLLPRERIEVRGGEISKGISRYNQVYEYLKPKLDNLKGVRGCITIQLFVDLNNDSYKALEINPRFGGGFPLSYEAGANYPRWLIKEYLCKEKISFYDIWERDLVMLRYDAMVLTHGKH